MYPTTILPAPLHHGTSNVPVYTCCHWLEMLKLQTAHVGVPAGAKHAGPEHLVAALLLPAAASGAGCGPGGTLGAVLGGLVEAPGAVVAQVGAACTHGLCCSGWPL